MDISVLHSDLKTDAANARVIELIDEIIAIIRRYSGENNLFKLYLFGSRTRNIADKGADIDLAVSCHQLAEKDFSRIKQEIDNMRTLYSIDIIHLEKVDSHFREIVLSDAKRIYG